MKQLIFFFLAAGLSALMTPLLMRTVRSKGLMRGRLLEKTAYRKRSIVPGLGGIVIYASVWSVLAIARFFVPDWFAGMDGYLTGVFIATSLLLSLGVLDDFKKLDYRVKFPVQIAAALILCAYGFRIERVTDPVHMSPVSLGVWSIPASVLWHLLVINAINLIDGLDGLAAGICVIAVGVLSAATQFEVTLPNLFCILLMGSLIGFLPYNFYPAKIFLGDAGSQVLGQFLSAVTLFSAMKSTVAITLTVPLAVLIIPNINAVLIALVRLGRGRNPFRSQSGFHLHYKLVRIGYSHREAVLLLYLISLFFGGVALWAIEIGNPAFSFWLTAIGVLVVVSIYFAIDRFRKI